VSSVFVVCRRCRRLSVIYVCRRPRVYIPTGYGRHCALMPLRRLSSPSCALKFSGRSLVWCRPLRRCRAAELAVHPCRHRSSSPLRRLIVYSRCSITLVRQRTLESSGRSRLSRPSLSPSRLPCRSLVIALSVRGLRRDGPSRPVRCQPSRPVRLSTKSVDPMSLLSPSA